MRLSEPILEGTLEELARITELSGERSTSLPSIQSAFKQESATGEKLSIPAADTGKVIYFGNREILTRFASMPMSAQRSFLIAIRKAMKEKESKRLLLTVYWGNHTKVLTIVAGGIELGSLTFYS